MEDTETYKKRARRLSAARAAKHFKENRDEINAKAREVYAKKKTGPPLTTEVLLEGVRALQLKPTTEKVYLDSIPRIMRMLEATDLRVALQDPEAAVAKFREARQKNGNAYSENTIKTNFQTICKLIDALNLDIDKTPYARLFEIQKLKKPEQGPVPTFEAYLVKSLEQFGADSKEYLLARLYQEITLRDDFGLTLTDGKMDSETNYLLVKRRHLFVVINSYKTEAKYGQIKHKLSAGVADLIRDYIAKHDKHSGDLLFDALQLSPFLNAMNETLGYSGGSNLFRQMRVSNEIVAATPEQRIDLAAEMRHGTGVQLNYVRSNVPTFNGLEA